MGIVIRSLVILAGILGALLVPAVSAGAQSTAASPEDELAARYLPVIYVRQQSADCARPPEEGEPYRPVPVEMVLGNERVLLRDGANGDQVIANGAVATDLPAQAETVYLDFPGDPRQPGCTFETDERLRTEELGFVPTTYVHIVADPEEGRLVLQYWFFWYFNDWNNTHEADWEMIQIMWDDAGSVEEALQQEPDRTAYSQHSAGERGTWGDEKIELEDGTRPVIYSAAGSHASFYSSRTFLQWGENSSGFGCDITTGPSERVEVTPVLVDDVIDPNGKFAWLLFEGRWGERAPSVFNGVNGPAFNDRWIEPWATTDRWPARNIVVPTSGAFGPTATDAFCSLTRSGSGLLIQAKIHPWLVLPAVALAVLALGFFYRRARPIIVQARKVYRAHWRVFLGIGLVAIPIGLIFNLVDRYLVARPLGDAIGDSAGAELPAVVAIGGVQQLAVLLVLAPAVIQAMLDIHEGRTPGVLRAYRMAAIRAPAIVLAALAIAGMVAIPLLVVIGVPVAVWLVVRWQYFAQVLIFNKDVSSLHALEESARLVRGRWWKTLIAAFLFDLLATVPGVVVGFGLLTIGNTAVGFANAVSTVLYGALIPVSVIAVTVMYLDRRGDPIRLGGQTDVTASSPAASVS